jgi:hypothetical protein
MKKIFKIFLMTALSVGVFQIAEAQRERSERSSGERSASSQPHVSREAVGSNSPSRSFSRGADNSNRNYNARPTPQRDNSMSRPTPQRDQTSRISPVRNWNNDRFVPSRNNNNNVAYNRITESRNNRYYGNRYSNYGYSNNYGYSYRNTYGHNSVYFYGSRYRYIPRSSISIYFGGMPYYYNQGLYYGYYGGYYQPLFPPFGLRIGVLPIGYSQFYSGVDPFYYYNGVYYRPYENNSYQVVDAPMGATVSSLPKGARSVVINGEKFYELNGTYYKSDRDTNGNSIFVVVGKNGEINNTDDGQQNDNGTMAPPSSGPQIGDVISELPEGSKITTINGQKLYLTPDHTYLKEESANGMIQYKVVGQ